MRNQDLILVAKKCHVTTAFRNTIGLPGHISVRLQPNHPTDDMRGIAASMLDGLLYGAGDAVIGINPATDSLPALMDLYYLVDEVINQYEIPTQSCILTHVTNQIQLIERGAPVDLVFQSIAGTEKANKSFGIDIQLLEEAQSAALFTEIEEQLATTSCILKQVKVRRCLVTLILVLINKPARLVPTRLRGIYRHF